jgi:hypothetical protein
MFLENKPFSMLVNNPYNGMYDSPSLKAQFKMWQDENKRSKERNATIK